MGYGCRMAYCVALSAERRARALQVRSVARKLQIARHEGTIWQQGEEGCSRVAASVWFEVRFEQRTKGCKAQGAKVHVRSHCAAPRLSLRRLCRHGRRCCSSSSRLRCHFRRQLFRLLQLICVQLSEPYVHITKQLAVAAKQAAAAAFAAAAGIQQGRSTACRCCLKGGCWGASRQRAQAARRAQAAACLAAGSAGAREGAGGRSVELF